MGPLVREAIPHLPSFTIKRGFQEFGNSLVCAGAIKVEYALIAQSLKCEHIDLVADAKAAKEAEAEFLYKRPITCNELGHGLDRP